MNVTRHALPRSAVLRGLGAAMALPLLDVMTPAVFTRARAASTPVRRLSFIYVGNGAAPGYWTPAVTGRDFELTPILQPLTPFRDRLIVVSGLDLKAGEALPGESAGGHGRISGAFLTGVHVKPTEGADFEAGVSVDQIAGLHVGKETQLASLELAIDSTSLSGRCDPGTSCAYVNTLCWHGPKTPLPMENNPRAVFERLFGDSSTTGQDARLRRIREDRSILDSVRESLGRLQQGVGTRDRAKLSEYTDAVRDIERRIQNAEAQSARELPVVPQPAGIPATFDEHVKLMFDLQVLAFQCDLTRVITFMPAAELNVRTYPDLGVPDAHHPLSHHRGDPDKIAKLAKVNTYHAQLLAYYLDKLKATNDGDGSLLDHITIVYGGGMSDPDLHMPHALPLLLAGGGAGDLHGGRHLKFPDGTPLMNLHLTLLNKLGVPVEKIGDSTGQFTELSSV